MKTSLRSRVGKYENDRVGGLLKKPRLKGDMLATQNGTNCVIISVILYLLMPFLGFFIRLDPR